MADLFLLSEAQMRRIERYFPLSHGIARVDDRRVISGIVFVIRNGLRWRDAPGEYGPHKTIYNRFVPWSRTHPTSAVLSDGWYSAKRVTLSLALRSPKRCGSRF
jgi:transposase